MKTTRSPGSVSSATCPGISAAAPPQASGLRGLSPPLRQIDDTPLNSDIRVRNGQVQSFLSVAQERAGVAPLLDVQDMIDTYPRPDDKSVMAYVAMLHKAMA